MKIILIYSTKYIDIMELIIYLWQIVCKWGSFNNYNVGR